MKKLVAFFLAPLFSLCIIACKHVPYGNNKNGKYYSIRGINMYCETYGSGQPLLMIHGNNGSISTFSGLIPYFSENYKVIVVDSRAQGKTIDQGDSISFEMMADDYAALLDVIHVDSADVIGWSDGGINALLLAMRHPSKVKKIVSSGANLWPDSTAIDAEQWKLEQVKYLSSKNRIRKTNKEKIDWKLFLLDWNQPHLSINSLHRIKCPTLIVCGEHDLIQSKHSLLIHNNIFKSKLWIVPNSGHATLFEKRRLFIKKVDQFFLN